jgi:hypothetical protein
MKSPHVGSNPSFSAFLFLLFILRENHNSGKDKIKKKKKWKFFCFDKRIQDKYEGLVSDVNFDSWLKPVGVRVWYPKFWVQ